MIPQGVMDLLVVHSPHSVAQNPGNTPTTITIQQLSSPPRAQPKEWDPPSLPRNPFGLPTSFLGSIALGWPRISQLGTPGTLNCSKSAHNIHLKALEPFPPHKRSIIGKEPTLHAYNLHS